MRTRDLTVTVAGTSPAASTTAIVGSNQPGDIGKYETVVIDAALIGATGGTLDIYIQRKIAPDTWRDVVHFPQLAAGAAAVKYTTVLTNINTTIVAVGGGSDATPAPALAANTAINVPLSQGFRVVAVTGSGAVAGAAISVQFTFYSDPP